MQSQLFPGHNSLEISLHTSHQTLMKNTYTNTFTEYYSRVLTDRQLHSFPAVSQKRDF
jgi:hypothetical protein